MITTAEQDKPSREESAPSQSGNRPSHGQHGGRGHSPQCLGDAWVGEVSGRIRHEGTERITLDDGTVLGLPWFFRAGPSELMKVGMMLKVKYEKRDGEKVVAFIEVRQGRS